MTVRVRLVDFYNIYQDLLFRINEEKMLYHQKEVEFLTGLGMNSVSANEIVSKLWYKTSFYENVNNLELLKKLNFVGEIISGESADVDFINVSSDVYKYIFG